MKVVKNTLIVIATLIGVFLLIFFGSAMFSAVSEVTERSNAQKAKYTFEDKLDSLSKQLYGKKVKVLQFRENANVLLYETSFPDIGGIKATLTPGDEVKIICDTIGTRPRFKVRWHKRVGYINYYFLPGGDALVNFDPDLN